MNKRNRRQFLEDSMLAAAVAVAANGTPLLAQESPVAGPSERLGVACVGVRGRGNSHISFFAGRKDTEILYICDVDQEVAHSRVQKTEARQGRAPKAEEDLRRVLDDPQVDIVSIATPNHWHALSAVWAMQAGKDVYVEKPVSHNVSEGRRIVQVARRHNRICQTGTQSRSNSGMIEAIQFVQQGGIGKVHLARGLCFKRRGPIGALGHYEIPQQLSYNLWLGPAPLMPLTRPNLHYDWHWQWDYGNGDLGNQGIHQMDLCRWGLGLSRLSNKVLSYGGRFGEVDAGQTPNTQVVLHNFGDKSIVFEVRGMPTPPLHGAKIGVIFEGTDGYVVMTSYHSGVAFDLDGNRVREFSGGGDHFANFLAAVRSRRVDELNADILEGHLSSALCHTGNISYRLGESLTEMQATEKLKEIWTTDNDQATFQRTMEHLRQQEVDLDTAGLVVGAPLPFDPESETFVDNDAANALLTREYRHPFVMPSADQVG